MLTNPVDDNVCQMICGFQDDFCATHWNLLSAMIEGEKKISRIYHLDYALSLKWTASIVAH